MERFLERLGVATAAHPWRTLSAWLLAAVALVGLGEAVGGSFINDFRVPNAESQQAADLARDHFPGFGAASADIVWHANTGTLRDPAVRQAITEMIAEVRQQPDVTDLDNPMLAADLPDSGGTLSDDGRTATSTVRYGKELGELTPETYHRLDDAAATVREHGVSVDFRGLVVEMAFPPATGTAEFIGMAVALLVLLLAFGSVVAAGLPIVIALSGLAIGTALVLLVGAVVDIPSSAPIVAVMLGIGAGIDYALFVVTRFRRCLAEGHDPITAAGIATSTSGHAVFYAGGTVVLAILGLLFTGIPFVAAMGVAAALVIAVMVVAALTLLPALLGLLGTRVNSLRPRRRHRDRPPSKGGWQRWADHLDRHRIAYAAGATAVLAVLAAPVLSLRLGAPDDGNQPTSWPQRRAYDRVAAQFGPGWNAPLLVTVPVGSGATADAALDELGRGLAADPDVQVVTPPLRSPDGQVALLTVIPRHAPQDPRVTDLVHRIRQTIAPAALRDDGARAYIGGQTAYVIDLADTVANRLPWVVLGVILGACLLLIAMFRSFVIAVKAALMTLLSIGAAYGAIVAVFQWGWGLSLLGLDAPVPIVSIVPMVLFAVLFGLSMDYEVFLLSAIREEYTATGNPHRAVVVGLSGTGRVITAAATIMAVVFVSFAAIDDTLVKMIGLGLAVAVIVDATVIRVVLAPAVMMLLGRLAWWPYRRRLPASTVPGDPPRSVPPPGGSVRPNPAANDPEVASVSGGRCLGPEGGR